MIKQIIGKENINIGMKCFEVTQNESNDNEKINLSIFTIVERPINIEAYGYFMKVKYSSVSCFTDISLQDAGIISNTYNNHKTYSYELESELEMVEQMTYGEFKQFTNINKGEKN